MGRPVLSEGYYRAEAAELQFRLAHHIANPHDLENIFTSFLEERKLTDTVDLALRQQASELQAGPSFPSSPPSPAGHGDYIMTDPSTRRSPISSTDLAHHHDNEDLEEDGETPLHLIDEQFLDVNEASAIRMIINGLVSHLSPPARRHALLLGGFLLSAVRLEESRVALEGEEEEVTVRVIGREGRELKVIRFRDVRRPVSSLDLSDEEEDDEVDDEDDDGSASEDDVYPVPRLHLRTRTQSTRRERTNVLPALIDDEIMGPVAVSSVEAEHQRALSFLTPSSGVLHHSTLEFGVALEGIPPRGRRESDNSVAPARL